MNICSFDTYFFENILYYIEARYVLKSVQTSCINLIFMQQIAFLYCVFFEQCLKITQYLFIVIYYKNCKLSPTNINLLLVYRSLTKKYFTKTSTVESFLIFIFQSEEALMHQQSTCDTRQVQKTKSKAFQHQDGKSVLAKPDDTVLVEIINTRGAIQTGKYK